MVKITDEQKDKLAMKKFCAEIIKSQQRQRELLKEIEISTRKLEKLVIDKLVGKPKK